jgi:Phosphoesterase family
MAIFSGSAHGTDGSDSCITSSATSLAGEAVAAGVTIKGYFEGLTSNHLYGCRHNPFSQFADAKAYETDFSNFPSDYSTLPQISFVVPNTADDMGDDGTITLGDTWDQANLSGYAQWAKANNSLLLIVSDESSTDPNYHTNMPGENGNNVPVVAVGAGIPAGLINGEYYDHYALLLTLEDFFGLGHLGASAASADLRFTALPATATTTTTTTTTTQAPPPAPTISAARLSVRRFRVASASTAVSARAPLGTTFHFTLSAAASVQIAIARSVAGVRSGLRCVTPTRALRRAHAPGCRRALGVGTLASANEAAGADHVPFTGRIGHHPLAGASYTATLTARNAAGVSKPVTLHFVVVALTRRRGGVPPPRAGTPGPARTSPGETARAGVLSPRGRLAPRASRRSAACDGFAPPEHSTRRRAT